MKTEGKAYTRVMSHAERMDCAHKECIAMPGSGRKAMDEKGAGMMMRNKMRHARRHIGMEKH